MHWHQREVRRVLLSILQYNEELACTFLALAETELREVR